ncbi:MAG TPA: hypothetical protein VL588_04705 [Bdellovibrionota bacterium]|jgi:hypothetical protein|nr:hypothetical protein [Bdellovibrionota bacterium]
MKRILISSLVLISSTAASAATAPESYFTKPIDPPKSVAEAMKRCGTKVSGEMSVSDADSTTHPMSEELKATLQKEAMESQASMAGLGQMPSRDEMAMVQDIQKQITDTQGLPVWSKDLRDQYEAALEKTLKEAQDGYDAKLNKCPVINAEMSGPDPKCADPLRTAFAKDVRKRTEAELKKLQPAWKTYKGKCQQYVSEKETFFKKSLPRSKSTMTRTQLLAIHNLGEMAVVTVLGDSEALCRKTVEAALTRAQH